MPEVKVSSTVKKSKVKYWVYDDGSAAALVFGENGKKSKELKNFESERKLREFFKTKSAKLIKIEPTCGIDRFSGDIFAGINIDVEEAQSGLAELEKMLSAYTLKGKDAALWNLFSYILSGYLARLFGCRMQGERPLFYRAPIVQIIGHNNDICLGYEHLARFVESVAVDTTKNRKIIFTNPTTIPSTCMVDEIKDCAYLYLEKDKEMRPAPTMYRDTAVLIHPYFFSPKEVELFVKRNPWASILVFDKKLKCENILVWTVDLNDLALPEWNWDVDKINSLMTSFFRWLSYTQISKDLCMCWFLWENVAQEVLFKNQLAKSSNRLPPMEGSERAYKILQIEALVAFIHFCFYNGVIDDVKRQELYSRWINGLLGNSYNYLATVVQQEKKHKAELDENSRILEDFKKIIKYILETQNGRFVKFVEWGEKFAGTDILDLQNGPWAQLFWVKPSEKKGEHCRAVKIRKDDLKKLCKEKGLLNSGEDITKLVSNCNKKVYAFNEIDFVYGFKNERFNFMHCTKPSNKEPVPSVVLLLDKLTFIDKNIRKSLENKFPEKK